MANSLASKGVKHVIYRQVDTEYDSGPALAGDERDIDLGRQWWRNGLNQRVHSMLDQKVIVQPWGLNEQNQPRDAWFYLGLMQEADTQGRKLAIFADSVGMPDQWRWLDGIWHSDVWSLRVSSGCLRYGKAHGHYACLHEYGSMGRGYTGNEPGSAIWPDRHRDDNAFSWFGGRHLGPYRDIIPEDSRMQILLGECGPARVNVVDMGGLSAVLSDMRGYQIRYASDPCVAGFCYWTVGGLGAWNWTHSNIDGVLPDLLEYVKGL